MYTKQLIYYTPLFVYVFIPQRCTMRAVHHTPGTTRIAGAVLQHFETPVNL